MLEEYFERLRSEPWRAKAACIGKNKHYFKIDTRGPEIYQKAIQICNTCPVKRQCLDFALANHERYGFWGGMTYRERCKEAKRRQGSASWVVLER